MWLLLLVLLVLLPAAALLFWLQLVVLLLLLQPPADDKFGCSRTCATPVMIMLLLLLELPAAGCSCGCTCAVPMLIVVMQGPANACNEPPLLLWLWKTACWPLLLAAGRCACATPQVFTAAPALWGWLFRSAGSSANDRRSGTAVRMTAAMALLFQLQSACSVQAWQGVRGDIHTCREPVWIGCC